MKHYKNLMSALGDAMPMCLAWKLAGTEDNYFNARDLFAFALSDDKEEGSLKEGQFYVVSAEGAIGIASGYEYLVLDLGDGMGHLRDFLESSDRIYMPAPEGIPEKVRTDAFESWIDRCGIPQVRDKIRRLRLSSEDLPKDRDRYAEQLVWTGLGRIAAGIADEV